MAQIVLDKNFNNNYDESENEIDINNNDILNYRGYFLENEEEEEEEQKYFEYGAHFPYKILYQKLEILKEERDEEEKNKIKEQNEKYKENTLQNIFNNFKSNKGKSRNRNNNNEKKNGFTFIPQKENQIINIKEKKKDNNKNRENNASSNVIQNKDKERTFDNISFQKKINENISLYPSKLKMNTHLNFSSKEDEIDIKCKKNNMKINSFNHHNNNNENDNYNININNYKTNVVNSKNIKSIQLSREHLNKILNSSTQQKNKLQKKIKNKNDDSNNNISNNFKKPNPKNKELSTSYNYNQNKLIKGSLNYIVRNYNNKPNINFRPSTHSNPTKITQNNEKKNINNPLSRNYNIIKYSQNTKNFVNRNKNNSSKFSEQNKKKLTISIEGKNNLSQDKKQKNNFKEILLSISKGNSSNHSRNKNINLTSTKSNIMSDREKNTQNLTNQNLLNNNCTLFNKNNHLQKKKNKNDKNENLITMNQRNKKNNSNGNKSKTLLDVKLNLDEKIENKILNQINKTMNINNIGLKINKNKIDSFISNQNKKKDKNFSQTKFINFHSSNTRNRPLTTKYNSKIVASNLFNHQKGVTSNNININININNHNKIIYNKIIDKENKSSKSKNNF